MTKKTLYILHTLLPMFLLFVFSQTSHAITLPEAFHQLITVKRPTQYYSQGRGFMTAGELDVHYPSQTVQLIDLSPPAYNAGCNGISLYLGGFSYINSEAFTALLKNISTAALGYTFQLALRSLCPVCSTVLSDMQKLEQAANKLAINQCQFSEGLVEKAMRDNASLRYWLKGKASSIAANRGGDADFFGAFDRMSSNMGDAFEKIEKFIADIQDGGTKAEALQSLPLGNSTWKLLSGLSKEKRIFIQSFMGTTLTYGATDKKKKTAPIVRPVEPTLTAQELTDLFEYGARAKQNKGLYLLECRVKPLFTSDSCTPTQKVLVNASHWYKKESAEIKGSVRGADLANYGFYGMVYALLFQAKQNIEQSKPINTPQTVALPAMIYGTKEKITAHFSAAEIGSFLSFAPQPLYRALSIAAVHSDVSENLLNSVAHIVAAHYTTAFLTKELLNIHNADNSQSGSVGLSSKRYQQLEQLLSHMRDQLNQKLTLEFNKIKVNQAWIDQVTQVQSLSSF